MLAKFVIISIVFAAISPVVMAASGGDNPPAKGFGNHNAAPVEQSGRQAAVEKAVAICATAVEHDDNGQPNTREVDECMAEKGFKKPHPHHRKAPKPVENHVPEDSEPNVH